MNKTILLFLACFAVASASNAVALQLVNALISASNISTSLTPSYTGLGFNAPPACATPAFPVLDFLQLQVCYGANIAYPFRNATAGYEFDLTAKWQALLTANYNASVTLQLVPITVGSSGLFPSLVAAINNGQCQVLLGTIYQNPTRDVANTASCSYAQVNGGLVFTPSAFPNNITSLAQLNFPNVTIAVANGSLSITLIQPQLPNANFLLTTGTSDSLSRIASGAANIAVGEGPVLQFYQKSNPAGCNGTVCSYFDGSNFNFANFQVVAYTPKAVSTTTSTTSSTVTGSTFTTSTFTTSTVSTVTRTGTTTVNAPNSASAVTLALSVVLAAVLLL